MEAPGITRQRRPFLAPIWLGALFLAIAIIALVAGYRSFMTTTVVVTQHAEKVLGTIANAPLTPAGEQRAQQLARVLGGNGGPGRLEAIYVLDIRSARQTAAPLAARLALRPVLVSSEALPGLAGRLLSAHRGRAVLVIGRSDTVAQLVRSLSGLVVPANEQDYGAAYVVSVPTLGKPSILKINY